MMTRKTSFLWIIISALFVIAAKPEDSLVFHIKPSTTEAEIQNIIECAARYKVEIDFVSLLRDSNEQITDLEITVKLDRCNVYFKNDKTFDHISITITLRPSCHVKYDLKTKKVE